MKTKNIIVTTSAGLILLLLAACDALRPTPIQPTPTEAVQPTTGVEYRFVTDQLLIPTTQAQAEAFALNVDGDPQGQPDNLFGKLFTLLTSTAPGLDLQSTLDQEVNSGQLVSLHMVKADDPLNDSSASWSIFQGEKSLSTPKFDGTDKFIIDSAIPVNLPIIGLITNGHFTGGPGAARVQMFLLKQLVDVDLLGVRLEADFSANGCANGKLGGGVTVDEFHSNLLPAITDGLNQMIIADEANANTLLQVFDSDHNGTITVQELENNPMLMMAFTPDLDLLDASTQFNPNQDGVKESYSVGMGFTCVAASFAVPQD
ncbi:MAG TPA: hypothetical protein VFI68_04400 [Anaerolineales bacterium]|nr:hypothetical protein [Anaerolineales bacterium]